MSVRTTLRRIGLRRGEVLSLDHGCSSRCAELGHHTFLLEHPRVGADPAATIRGHRRWQSRGAGLELLHASHLLGDVTRQRRAPGDATSAENACACSAAPRRRLVAYLASTTVFLPDARVIGLCPE